MREIRVFPPPDRVTPKQVRIIEAATAVWLGCLVGLAIWIATEIYRLDVLTGLVAGVGGDLRHVASVLRGLSGVPVVGPALHIAANRLGPAAASATGSAANARSAIHQLAYLLAAAIVLIPGVPTLVVLSRFRSARWRERRALQQALSDPGRRPVAIRYLAGRAIDNLGYGELVRIRMEPDTGDRPDGGLSARLARAEAERLGLAASWVSERSES